MRDVRSTLLGAAGKKKFDSVTVTIDGEPLTVFMRTPSGRERDNFEESILKEKTVMVNGKPKRRKDVNHDNIRAKLIALCACKGSDDPTPIFTADDVAKLGDVDASILDPLFDKASELAGLSKDDVKELAGN